jgi:hypothetical protein
MLLKHEKKKKERRMGIAVYVPKETILKEVAIKTE